MNDLLRSLQEEGFLKMWYDHLIDRDETTRTLGTLDEGEEKGVFWMIGDAKHWYQV